MSRATFSGLVLAAMSGLACGACQADATSPGTAGFGAAPTAGVGAAGQGGSAIQGRAGTGAGGSPTGGQAGTGARTDAAAGADAAGHDASAITDRRCPAESSSPQRTDFSKAGPLTAATMDLTFEDKSRRLPATANQPGAPSRTLVTTIYYPSSGPPPFLVGPS